MSANIDQENEVEITPEMIEAGAEIIRHEKYDLPATELARQVFAAMIRASDGRRLSDV
jgi:hypothetical protein